MSVKHMALVLDHYDGKPHLKLTMLILADHADADGYCYPSYGRIAARLCCSRRQAITNVQALIASGLVEVAEQGGRKPNGHGGVNVSNVFRVLERPLRAMPRLEPVDKPVRNRVPLHPRGEAHFTPIQEVKPTSPKPSLEPSEITVMQLRPVDDAPEDPEAIRAEIRRSLEAARA